jgi:hypothetical protein
MYIEEHGDINEEMIISNFFAWLHCQFDCFLIDYHIDNSLFLIVFHEFILNLLYYLAANNWNEITVRIVLNYAGKELESVSGILS